MLWFYSVFFFCWILCSVPLRGKIIPHFHLLSLAWNLYIVIFKLTLIKIKNILIAIILTWLNFLVTKKELMRIYSFRAKKTPQNLKILKWIHRVLSGFHERCIGSSVFLWQSPNMQKTKCLIQTILGHSSNLTWIFIPVQTPTNQTTL